MFVISPAYASFTDSILIQVEGDFRKVYYNEKNVTSVLFGSNLASITFETGSDAALEIKAPKVYKTGPELFILKNGEEIAPETTADDCFYYVNIETEMPETIELIFAFWPEYPETIKGCETFIVSPLKQFKSGIYGNDIQCRDERVLVLKKSSELHSCVKPETVPKLFARNWDLNEVETIETDTAQQDSKLIKITGVIDRRLTPEGFEYHLIPLHEELPRIEYTGYNTLNLFSTKDTIHYFLRNLEGSLVNIEGKFLLDDGDYFRHYSGFPTIPVQKLELISESKNLEYSIEGAEFLSITEIPDAMTLNIAILEAQKGVLEITIPRALFDATIGGEDDDFFVVVDGFEVDFTENGNSVERTLTIQFEKGARMIEIIGPFPIGRN